MAVPTVVDSSIIHGALCPASRCRAGWRAECRTPPDLTVQGRSSATPTGLEPAASAVTGRRANQLRYGALRTTKRGKANPSTAVCRIEPGDRSLARTPNGIRTRATAVKGRGPRPLDDGGNSLEVAVGHDCRRGPVQHRGGSRSPTNRFGCPLPVPLRGGARENGRVIEMARDQFEALVTAALDGVP